MRDSYMPDALPRFPSVLTPLVGRQEGPPACKLVVGGKNVTRQYDLGPVSIIHNAMHARPVFAYNIICNATYARSKSGPMQHKS